MSNETLMKSIKERWGGLISQLCATSSVPPKFIAGLIANESGGNPSAARFEPHVFARFRSLQATDNVKPYAGLTGADVRGADDLSLCGLATSWGLTQIMGYHALHDNHQPRDLCDPAYALTLTLRLLAEFAERFGLDVTKEFDEMFRVWNTGNPDGKTFDPNYSANGIARANIYELV